MLTRVSAFIVLVEKTIFLETLEKPLERCVLRYVWETALNLASQNARSLMQYSTARNKFGGCAFGVLVLR